MTTLVLAAMLSAAVLPAAGGQSSAIDGTWRAQLQDNWTRNDNRQWINLRLDRDDNRQFGFSIPIDELEGLGARGARFTANDVRFSVKRDAGSVAFQGNFNDGRGTGTWRFAPNADFVAAMRKNYGELSVDDVFKLAIHDVSRNFIAAMNQEGYPRPSLDELTKMRIHGVDAVYVQGLRKAGYDKLSVDELVKTRIHGATPAFAQEVSTAGLKATVDDLVKMRIHGVTPDFIKEMRSLGYKDLGVDDLVKMRIHGVTPEFIREMRARGFKDLSIDDLVGMRIHGVSPEFIKEIEGFG
jgi:predicted metallopeptidase